MVIKKLNSLFHKHSRWLFGIFAAVIIIAFMDFLTPGRGGCAFSGSEESQVAGTAFGEEVTFGDLIKLDREIQIFEAMLGGRSQREAKTLFYYYCVLERAKQLGYTLSDKQVAEMVKFVPAFADETGSFSKKKYDEFLSRLHISSAELVNAVRKCMIMQQLPMMFSGNVSVSDAEVESVYRSNFPRLAIRAFQLKGTDFEKLVKVDDKVLEKYMAAHKSRYVIPSSMEVLAFELSSAPFTAEAEKAVTMDYVKRFIREQNIPNGKPEIIRPILVTRMAGELAEKRMWVLHSQLTVLMENAKDNAERAKIFREFAAKNKFTLIESKKVLVKGVGVDDIRSPELVAELRHCTASNPLTRPRLSAGGAAIAFLISRTPERAMTFKEAKVQIAKDYIREEGVKLARIKAAELYKSIMKLAPAKRRAAFSKLGKLETINFSMLSVPENNPGHMNIIYAASQNLRTMKTGDISKVIDTEDGAMLVEMFQRTPALMSDFPKHKMQIRSGIIDAKSQQLTNEFMNYIDRNCRFEADDRNPEK